MNYFGIEIPNAADEDIAEMLEIKSRNVYTEIGLEGRSPFFGPYIALGGQSFCPYIFQIFYAVFKDVEEKNCLF